MRVTVVGAGVVGLCCAWYLRQDGHDVTVVDKGGAEDDRCSLGNSGLIVPSHFVTLAAPGMVGTGLKMMAKKDSPFRIKPSLDPELATWCLQFMKHCTQEHVDQCAPVLLEMHLQSRELYCQLAEFWGDCFGFRKNGLLMVCGTEAGLLEETKVADAAKNLDLNIEVLTPADVERFDPNCPIQCEGAVYFADDCHLSPKLLMGELLTRLAQEGVRFRWNESFEQSSDDVIVFAAGSWSAQIAKRWGITIPLQPGKGMSFMAPNSGPIPRTPMLLKEAKVAVTPMADGVRFGGTMELGEWSTTPDKSRARAMREGTAKFLPGFQGASLTDQTLWTGFRPCSPDGMPYIGQSRRSPHVFLATGHGMMGMSLGPVTGRLIADAVNGQSLHPSLSPDRFA